MPVETVEVPLNSGVTRVVRIVYLCEFPFIREYFQGLRSGLLARTTDGHPEKSCVARNYLAMESTYARRLERELPDRAFDAILSPPSRYDQAAVYRDAYMAVGRARRDLTDRLRKLGVSLSGEGATLEQIVEELKYDARGDEGCLRSVLIVDDTFNTGRTVAAVITRLMEAGVPEDCSFAVAVPFWARLN